MRLRAQSDPRAQDHHALRGLGGVWLLLTAIILLSVLMTLLSDWPSGVPVFFLGVWLVVSVPMALPLRRRAKR